MDFVRHMRLLGMIFAVSLMSGCYAYQEVDRSSLGPGQTVRVHLSAEPARSDVTGLDLARSVAISGRLVEWDAERVVMIREWMGPERAYGYRATADTVRANWSAVASVERSEFSLLRTGAAIAGGAVLVALGAKKLFGDWAGGRDVPRPEGPETFRPVFP